MTVISSEYLDAKKKYEEDGEYFIFRTCLNINPKTPPKEIMTIGGLRYLPKKHRLSWRQKLIISILHRCEMMNSFCSFTVEELSEIIGENEQKIYLDLGKLMELKLIKPFSFKEVRESVYGADFDH